MHRSAPRVSVTVADPILEGIGERMKRNDRISLNLQTGDLVTIHGVSSMHNDGKLGVKNHLGLVVSMFQDEGERWLADVEWLKLPQRTSPRATMFGTYYNFRYATCTQWVGKVGNETLTENFSSAD